MRVWGFDEGQRRLLWAATTELPELRAIVERAQPQNEVPGMLVLRATVEELDEMYSLVEELTDGSRSRKRRDLLDDLCSSRRFSVTPRSRRRRST
jgi:hypothetical protein